MSEFFICRASSTFIPFIISVAYELEAMADPQPKVYSTQRYLEDCLLDGGAVLVQFYLQLHHVPAGRRSY